MQFLITDITVSFRNILNLGKETVGYVEIYLLISNPSSFDITLQVNSQDDSASSKGIL